MVNFIQCFVVVWASYDDPEPGVHVTLSRVDAEWFYRDWCLSADIDSNESFNSWGGDHHVYIKETEIAVPEHLQNKISITI